MGFNEATITDLENLIGDQLYIKIENWNLYLNDAGLARKVAIECLSNLDMGSREAAKVSLDKILVKIGDDNQSIPLSSLITLRQINDLTNILDSFEGI